MKARFSQDALMAGARNCIDSMHIKKDEVVLVVADGEAPPSTIRALVLAARETGAIVHTLTVERIPGEEYTIGFGKLPKLTPSMWNALKSADVIIDVSMICPVFRLLGYGVRTALLMAPNAPAEFVASEFVRFPHQMITEIGKKVHEVLDAGETVRIVDPQGTDLKFVLDHDCILPYFGSKWFTYDMPTYGMLPPLPAITMLPVDAEGVLYYEYCELFKGRLTPPIKLTIEKGWVTEVEGGREARKLQSLIKDYKNLDYASEFGIGVNPKMPLIPERGGNYVWRSGHKAGRCWLQLGDSWVLGGKIQCTFGEMHGMPTTPTVYVDNKVLIDDGELTVLEDQDIRRAAAKFGDPDAVLSTEALYRFYEIPSREI